VVRDAAPDGARLRVAHMNGEAATSDQKDLLDYYKFQKDHAKSYEDKIYDTTKYNFFVFGAVFLLSSSSVLATTVSTDILIVGACIIVAAISLAASIMVLFFWKYILASEAKAKVIEKALWRKRSFKYVESKYRSERLPEVYADAAAIRFEEFWTAEYVLKWINLIPFAVAVLLGLVVATGIVPVKHPADAPPASGRA
jgi:hypothetical protein